jgi:hypothetical protein
MTRRQQGFTFAHPYLSNVLADYTKLQRIQSPYWVITGRSKTGSHHFELKARAMAIADPILRLAYNPQLSDFESQSVQS